jgi:hypothetical protein
MGLAVSTELRQIFTRAGAGISWEEFDLLHGPARLDAAQRTGAVFARRDPSAAWQAVAALPPGEDRHFLQRGVLVEWATRAPLAAAEQLKLLPENQERANLARLFFEQWAAAHPSDAADAVSRFPAGPTRDAATDAVLVKWVASAPPDAGRWAAHIPWTRTAPAPLTEIGMGGALTLTGVHYDRGDAMQLVAFEWSKTDPKAAAEWAESAVDPGLKTLLLKWIRR